MDTVCVFIVSFYSMLFFCLPNIQLSNINSFGLVSSNYFLLLAFVGFCSYYMAYFIGDLFSVSLYGVMFINFFTVSMVFFVFKFQYFNLRSVTSKGTILFIIWLSGLSCLLFYFLMNVPDFLQSLNEHTIGLVCIVSILMIGIIRDVISFVSYYLLSRDQLSITEFINELTTDITNLKTEQHFFNAFTKLSVRFHSIAYFGCVQFVDPVLVPFGDAMDEDQFAYFNDQISMANSSCISCNVDGWFYFGLKFSDEHRMNGWVFLNYIIICRIIF